MDSHARNHIITLTQELEMGTRGVDKDPFNPLCRAFRVLLEDGRPMKRAALCFFDPNEGEGYGKDIRWFGVFVHSAGGRLLFFPGLANREKGYKLQGKRSRSDNEFLNDHVTMERGFREIHATAMNSEGHVSLGKPEFLGQGRYFWFGISVQRIERLRPLKRFTRIQVEVPASDSERRM